MFSTVFGPNMRQKEPTGIIARYVELVQQYRERFGDVFNSETLLQDFGVMNARIERCLAEGHPMEYYFPEDPGVLY